jgi:S1-C subfamily serine protease
MRILSTLTLGLAFLVLASPLFAGESVLERLDEEIRGLAKKAAPAVVKVSVEREFELPDGIGSDRHFVSKGTRVGTGFLVSNRGLIVTTERLAEGASSAHVEFPDGVIRQGEILGSDRFFKIAVVKVEPVEGLEPLRLADESEPGFGALTIFLGYSYGRSRSISLGLVTGTRVTGVPFDRFDNFLTVNARQNPGDTGGPFLDRKGRVIGMSVTGRANVVSVVGMGTKDGGLIQGFPGISGPAYAVPAADLAFAVEEIEAHGRVRIGRLGVNVLRKSLEVKDVHLDTPAERAGIRPGDVVLALNDAPVRRMEDFLWILRRTPVGREFSVKLRRAEEEKTVRLAMEEFVPAALPGISIAIKEEGVTVLYVDAKNALFDVRIGDRILAVDGEATESGDALLVALKAVSSQPKTLDVVREGVRLTLDARPVPVPDKKAPPEKE